MKAWIYSLSRSARSLKKVRPLVLCALLLACQVALNLVASIPLGPSVRISFGYLAQAACGMLLGPVPAALTGALSDILVLFLKPTGPYFPGFTLSAMLGGLIYGLALYDREPSLKRLLLGKLVIDVLVNLLLNTLWLDILYGKAFWVILPARALKNLVQYPVDILLLYPVLRLLWRMPGRKDILPGQGGTGE